MSPRKIVLAACAGCLTLGLVSASLAAGEIGAADAITQRQELMKADGGLLKKAFGEAGTDAVATLEQLHDNLGKLPGLFPEGSTASNSKALPSIWQDFSAFSALFTKAQDHAAAAIDAAKAGDAAAYQASVKAVAGVCGECHQAYRAANM